MLGFVHRKGYVHGAVLSPHLLIHPAEHTVVLIDWCYAVKDRAMVAVVPDYRDDYPGEVFAKEVPGPGLDLWLAANTMVKLMGGADRISSKPIAAFMRGCLLPKPAQRPQDAWALLDEFTDLIERLWGKRRYRPLAMP